MNATAATIGIVGWAIFWVGVFVGTLRIIAAPPDPEHVNGRRWILKPRPIPARAITWIIVGGVVGIAMIYPTWAH